MATKTVQDLVVPVGVTLDRFIMHSQSAFPYATGELSQLLRDIAMAGKIINREINRAGLIDIAGGNGTENVQGENQQKLDIVANIRFIRALKNGGEVCAILSEEEEDIIHTGNDHGKYVVAMDPLDGSSNIDVNVSIGSIFSIYRRVTPINGPASMEDFLQGGRKQVAAGYILYGSSTMLVYSTGDGVNGFTFDQSLGEFILSHKNMGTPAEGSIYSVNEGHYHSYPTFVQQYIAQCKSRNFSARYIGSLVGDFHRNMLKGGIYLYPSTQKDPKGKLRLLYECYPLAFIAEKSGGKASDGFGSILDILPQSFHQRSPLYIGSAGLVDDVVKG
ncbi:MAG: fructose-bisphosphatase [Dyadobacter sp. 50-39]|uniref:class 1 fructose-bisphosphatase n=1 Tax=Dyadobacter sp. 50-39 TaxID=1895756 RepID=UPI0009674CC2|nr:class 1 fructose-bisphosphatase [Dyadobacter sp. 50-39]OJV21336.1 MAG: fructose-bisphosphatase [Dyadobacter sp. 50-39]